MTGQEARDNEREALARPSIRDLESMLIAAHAEGARPADRWAHMAVAVQRLIESREATLAARKHPEPEITEARIDAAAVAMFEATYGNGDWVHREEIEEKVYRDRARVALTAALTPDGQEKNDDH